MESSISFFRYVCSGLKFKILNPQFQPSLVLQGFPIIRTTTINTVKHSWGKPSKLKEKEMQFTQRITASKSRWACQHAAARAFKGLSVTDTPYQSCSWCKTCIVFEETWPQTAASVLGNEQKQYYFLSKPNNMSGLELLSVLVHSLICHPLDRTINKAKC